MSVVVAEAAIVAWVRAATGLAASNVLWALQNATRPAGAWVSLRLVGDKPVGLAAVRQAFNTFVAVTFTTTHAADTLTIAAHGLATGAGPLRVSTTATPPAGLAVGTDYYVIKVDANTIKLATSYALALAGTAVAITSDGTGVHTLTAAGVEITRTVEQLTTWTLSIQAFGGDATGASAPRNLLSLIRAHARLPARALLLRSAGVGVLSFTPITSLDGGLSDASVEPRASMTVALCVPVEVSESLGYIATVEVTDETRNHLITITDDD